jgi:cyanobactin cluster PatC/TenC/TruC protein
MTQTQASSASVAVLSFDGKDDRVELGRQPQFKIEPALTLEAWIYPQAHQSKWTGIVSCIYDTGKTESGYGLLLDGKTGIQFGLTPSSTNQIIYLSSKAHSLKLNQWQHIAGTFDGEQMRVYVDGVLRATRQVSSPGICYQPENDLTIGMYRDNNQTYSFLGTIAEVRLWNVARSPAQLLADRHRRLTGTEQGLVGYWQLQEGTGAIAHDRTSHGNHGTIPGNPIWESSTLTFEAGATNLSERESAIAPTDATPPVTVLSIATVLANPAPPEVLERVSTVIHPEGIETMAKTNPQSTDVAPIAPTSTYGSQSVLILSANHQGIAVGSGALRPQGRFTIEAWVYPDTDAGKQVIFADGEARLYLEGGKLKFQTTATQEAIASSGAGLIAGNWYHVAVAWTGSHRGNTRLYINGVRSDNKVPIAAVLGLGDSYLGRSPDMPDSGFQGKLLEVRVWRFARSKAEIAANLLYPLTGRELGLARCWSLTQTVGSTIQSKTTNRSVGSIGPDAVWAEVAIPLKLKLDPQELLVRSTGLVDYGFWFKEMAKQQKTETDPPFRRGRIWA